MNDLNPEVNDFNGIPVPTYGESFRNPEKVANKEFLERFMAQLNHPGAPKTSNELTDFILDTAGMKLREGLSEERQQWRDRIMQLQHSTMVLSYSQYDAIIDPRNEDYDEPFAELEKALQATRPYATDMKDERQALSILMNLRIAAIRERTDDDQHWMQTAQRLVGELPI